jgi:tRNA G18 (ribose-2'-O)-methylase SpoU
VRHLIERVDDERIGVYLGLRDHVARQQRELPGGDMAGSFIAEGDVVIERALEHGCQLQSVLIGAGRTKPLPQAVHDDIDIFLASDKVLTAITGRAGLRDPLSCFIRPALSDAKELLATHRTFAVLESINNPNNLGVIMRNAAGLGVDAVLLDPTCGDPLYRRAIRASMGQVFSIPHARLESLSSSLDQLHAVGVTTVALTPSGETELRDVPQQDRVAVLVGAEGPGLTDGTLQRANVRARISMTHNVDSLNVAAAAAIAFHHFGR